MAEHPNGFHQRKSNWINFQTFDLQHAILAKIYHHSSEKEKTTWPSVRSSVLKKILVMVKYPVEICRPWASVSLSKNLPLSMQFLFTGFHSSCLMTAPHPRCDKTQNLKESIFSTDIHLGIFYVINRMQSCLCLTKICLLCSLPTC